MNSSRQCHCCHFPYTIQCQNACVLQCQDICFTKQCQCQYICFTTPCQIVPFTKEKDEILSCVVLQNNKKLLFRRPNLVERHYMVYGGIWCLNGNFEVKNIDMFIVNMVKALKLLPLFSHCNQGYFVVKPETCDLCVVLNSYN